MVNGQETAVCVFSGQIVQFTSVDFTNSEAVLRERYIVQMIRGLRLITPSLYCHWTVMTGVELPTQILKPTPAGLDDSAQQATSGRARVGERFAVGLGILD